MSKFKFDFKANSKKISSNGFINEVYNLNEFKDVQDRGVNLRARINTEAKNIAKELVNRIRKNQLSGQKLNEQSGKLKKSIKSEIKYASGSTIINVDTDLSYGKMFDKGYTGTQFVKARMERRNKVFSKLVPTYTRLVKAHARKIDIKARDFIDEELNKMQPEIVARFNKILVRKR